jgi:hypothetical protein
MRGVLVKFKFFVVLKHRCFKSREMHSDDDMDDSLEDEDDVEIENEMAHDDYGITIEHEKAPFEMTQNHSKILILISKYATAGSGERKESWIRELPLTVMIYEGITAEVIDCDYAPKSMIISSDGRLQHEYFSLIKSI